MSPIEGFLKDFPCSVRRIQIQPNSNPTDGEFLMSQEEGDADQVLASTILGLALCLAYVIATRRSPYAQQQLDVSNI